jgi:hypothetical protein
MMMATTETKETQDRPERTWREIWVQNYNVRVLFARGAVSEGDVIHNVTENGALVTSIHPSHIFIAYRENIMGANYISFGNLFLDHGELWMGKSYRIEKGRRKNKAYETWDEKLRSRRI